jgi:hypothetical protein
VHHQHAETMPELAPYVSDAETWAIRRQLYEELLAKPDTVLRHRRRWQRSRPGAASSYSASRRKSAPEPVFWGTFTSARRKQRPSLQRHRPTWLYLSRFEGRG